MYAPHDTLAEEIDIERLGIGWRYVIGILSVLVSRDGQFGRIGCQLCSVRQL